MVYADHMARTGRPPFRDETGTRTETMPLMKVTPGEKAAFNEAAGEAGYESYTDWARDVLKKAARGLRVSVPKEVKRKQK